MKVAAAAIAGEDTSAVTSGPKSKIMTPKGEKPKSKAPAVERQVAMSPNMTLRELALAMGVRLTELLARARQLDPAHRRFVEEDIVDMSFGEALALEFNVMPVAAFNGILQAKDAVRQQFSDADRKTFPRRMPVVTIMGHVDHGKTSLLDALRGTDVAAHEAGGITQHLGAFTVNGVTFIDTPGHAAFTAMRAKGAQVTDIVVIVVAADDGLKPQTVEAIAHAKAASVPIIVAVNKIDKPGAAQNIPRIESDLLIHGLVSERMGGDIQVVPVSALKKMNLDQLLDAVTLQSELLDLRAPTGPFFVSAETGETVHVRGEAVALEAHLDRNLGPVATVLVRSGTLKIGDVVVAGTTLGRIRALKPSAPTTASFVQAASAAVARAAAAATATATAASPAVVNMTSCGPSVACEIVGLKEVPDSGEDLFVVSSEARARDIVDARKSAKILARTHATVSSSAAVAGDGTQMELLPSSAAPTAPAASPAKEIPVVVKGDVAGTVEAIVSSLLKLKHPEVSLRIIHSAVGPVTPTDVLLAEAGKGIVVAFNVRVLHRSPKVPIRHYSVIYELIDDMKAQLTDLLDPRVEEVVLGNAEVVDVFDVSKKLGSAGATGNSRSVRIGGCKVVDGSLFGRGKTDALYRIMRNGRSVAEHVAIAQLKRFKDEVEKVAKGFECGVLLDNAQIMLEKGDSLVCYELRNIRRSFDESAG